MTTGKLNHIPDNSTSADVTESPRRFWLATGGVLLIALLLLILPPDLSQTLFTIGVLISGGFVTRYALINARPGLDALRQHPSVGTLRSISLIGSLLLILISTMMLARAPYYTDALYALLPITGGILLMGGAVLLRPARSSTQTAQTEATDTTQVNLRLTIGGFCLLLLVAQTNLIPPPFWSQTAWVSHHVQMLMFYAGLMLLGAGLYDFNPETFRLPRLTLSQTGWLLVGIVALAFGLRIWNLTFGIHRLVDEIHFMDAVARLRDSGSQRILMPHGSVTAFTWLYPYWQLHSTQLFGTDLFALRLVSAIIGTAQVIVLYHLGKILFSVRVGLIAAALLATFPAHLQFSRIGLNNIVDPLPGMLAMLFLIRGMKRHQAGDFALAGIFLGLTHYFYEGGRLFYTPFVALWVGWLLLFMWRDHDLRLPTYRHGLFFLAGFLPVAGIFYYTWDLNQVLLTPRLASVGQGFLLQGESRFGLLTDIQRMVMNLIYLPEIGSFFNDEVLVHIVALPFFLLGMAQALWRLRDPGYALVFWWLLAVSVAGGLIIGGPFQTPRYVVGFPAIVLLIALGLDTTLRMISSHVRLNDAVRIAITACLMLAGIYQFHGVFLPDYYDRQFYVEYASGEQVRDFDDVLFRIVRLPTETDVTIISPGLWGSAGYPAFLRFYGRRDSLDLRFNAYTSDDAQDRFTEAYHTTRNRAFFLDPDDTETVNRILSLYPELQGPVMSPYPIPPERQLAMYYSVSPVTGATATDFDPSAALPGASGEGNS